MIAECIEWARENVWSEEAALIEGATGEDGDIKTQYLRERIEKLRRETALADLKIGERNDQLVDASALEQVLNARAAVIRGGLERLERQFGPDALDIVLDVIDEVFPIDLRGDDE